MPHCNWCSKPATVRAAVRLADDYNQPEFEENGRKYGYCYWGCKACVKRIKREMPDWPLEVLNG